jgi:hypothetical protein
MNDTDKANRGLFDGKESEGLFCKPLIKLLHENELPELFKKVEGLGDHRLLAIVTALLVEDRIDKVNSLFMPRYSKLLEVSDFTFSMKIRLLEALSFIPYIITTSAHCLREIRNAFAHNLNKKDFSHLEEKIVSRMRSLCDEAWRNVEPSAGKGATLSEVFRKLSFYCIAGLDAYAGNVKLLRDEVSKQEFLESINRSVHEMNKAALQYIEQVTSGSPIKTEIQGNQLYETFEGGIVKVSTIEGNEQELKGE